MLKKFGSMGEKTGWTYIEVPLKVSEGLSPGTKVSFRVKGKLDEVEIKQQALLPMGGGNYILPVKAELRKQLKRKSGDEVSLQLYLDISEIKILKSFLDCLKDEPEAQRHFNSLPASHQHYYSKWIEEAKTETTRIKRIALAINTLAKKMNYAQMIQSRKNSD